MAKELPVGTAQRAVLDALGAPSSVDTWDKAKAYFAELGIVVTAKRDGRKSVPVVFESSHPQRGGWNPGNEDGWSGNTPRLTTEQRNALQQWWVD